jgi:transposase
MAPASRRPCAIAPEATAWWPRWILPRTTTPTPSSRFSAAHREVLRLLFPPPYSPALNPIERVWELTGQLCTHNRYFSKLDELVEAVAHQMRA